MGILTELFVCKADEARAYDMKTGSRFERAELGGLTCLEFGTLWSILENEAWDVGKHELPEVASTDETWLFSFPDAFIARLEGLQPSESRNVATQWAATEELAGSDPSDLEPAIEALVKLARSARSKGQCLFLWNSL